MDEKLSDSTNKDKYDNSLHDLEGWLLLLGISIFLSILQNIKSIKNYCLILCSSDSKNDYSKIFLAHEKSECLYKIGLTTILMLNFIFFFKKKKIFKRMFTLFCIFNILSPIIDLAYIFDNNVPVDFGIIAENILKTTLYSLICIIYIKKSQRVNHTFIF